MRPITKENSENKQKCQYNDETIISQAVYQTEDRPNFPMFPWEQVDRLLAAMSEGVRLIDCAVSFQDFQPM